MVAVVILFSCLEKNKEVELVVVSVSVNFGKYEFIILVFSLSVRKKNLLT